MQSVTFGRDLPIELALPERSGGWERSRMRRRRQAWLIAGLVALLGLLWLGYGAYRGFTDVEIGENVPRVPWLPDSASNVSFYRSYPFTAYEFDIPEQDFLEWAEDHGWDVRRIKDEEKAIYRHHFGGGRLKYPDEPPADATEAQEQRWLRAVEEYAEAFQKKIDNGYYYRYEQSNGGGITVGYDLDTGRAYFQSSPR